MKQQPLSYFLERAKRRWRCDRSQRWGGGWGGRWRVCVHFFFLLFVGLAGEGGERPKCEMKEVPKFSKKSTNVTGKIMREKTRRGEKCRPVPLPTSNPTVFAVATKTIGFIFFHACPLINDPLLWVQAGTLVTRAVVELRCM